MTARDLRDPGTLFQGLSDKASASPDRRRRRPTTAITQIRRNVSASRSRRTYDRALKEGQASLGSKEDRGIARQASGRRRPGYPCLRAGQETRLAGVPGFEPGNGGIKIRCLTTWLHPTGPMFLGGFAMFCNCFGSIRRHFGPRRLYKDQAAGNLALIEAELLPDIRSGGSIIPKTF